MSLAIRDICQVSTGPICVIMSELAPMGVQVVLARLKE
jgi:hypothetical protein